VWASSLEGASRYLGLTRDNILRLIENSLLVPVFTPMNNRSEWKFDRAVLQDFFAKIISQIIPLSFLSSLELQTFASALRVMNRQLSSFARGYTILLRTSSVAQYAREGNPAVG